MVDWLEWLLSFVLKYFLYIYIIVWFGVYLESKLLIYFYFLLRFRPTTVLQIFTYSTEKVGAEHSSLPQPLRVRIITSNVLVIGPLALGITFEFWKNLVVRYLRDPNLHDHKILHAIEDGDGGLTPKEFTKRECLYLTLTSILRQEEIKFLEQSLLDNFDPYAEEEWLYPQRYPSRRFAHNSYILVPHCEPRNRVCVLKIVFLNTF